MNNETKEQVKVRILSSDNQQALQKDINDFLEALNRNYDVVTLLDIKFQIGQISGIQTYLAEYHAMIIYQTK